jgi:hypothetical protein
MGAGFNALAQAGVQNAEREAQLKDEKRKVLLKTLQEDAETPQDKVAAVDAVYHKDPGVLKQHVENLTRRITGKQPQPVVPPEQAQQARLAPLVARGKTPDQQALAYNQSQTEIANKGKLSLDQQQTQQDQQQTFALIDKYLTDPEQNKAAKEDYVRKQAGIQTSLKNIPGSGGQPYQNPNGQWVRPVQNADGTIAEQPMPAGWKPTTPAPKQSNAALATYLRAKYGDSPTAEQIEEGTRAHQRMMSGLTIGSHQTLAYDADGVPHVVTLSTSSHKDFGGTAPDSGSPKGPAPKRSAGGTPQPKKDQLDFRKGTPAQTKARGDYDEAVKLSSLADQVSARPNDAINQKRLAVALERASAGRFTTQALDYIIKAGWGNTLEQWANNPSTGALPTDVMRQLVDGAHQNQTASLKALQAAATPTSDLAPKGEPKVGDKKKFPNGKSGVWDGQGWVAQ